MEILGDEDEDEDDTYYTQQAVPIDGIKYPAMFVYWITSLFSMYRVTCMLFHPE